MNWNLLSLKLTQYIMPFCHEHCTWLAVHKISVLSARLLEDKLFCKRCCIGC
uniref:Uncharacterized protein n=1 Tax=Arundo donax TaxID=35708 RepID=A0A0A9B664_ARUDO